MYPFKVVAIASNPRASALIAFSIESTSANKGMFVCFLTLLKNSSSDTPPFLERCVASTAIMCAPAFSRARTSSSVGVI